MNLPKSWSNTLNQEFSGDYLAGMSKILDIEYSFSSVFPPKQLIFAALEACPVSEVKVVIIGQDPYHGIGQANGLSFSVHKESKLPPSLKNIYKELESDLNIKKLDGDLIGWSRQGVLLLNSILTVREGLPGSHAHLGWEKFTDEVIKAVNKSSKNLVFILWGAYAQTKKSLISSDMHLVIESPHPSPLSAYRGFFGSKPFSKTNNYFITNNKTPIDWSK